MTVTASAVASAALVLLSLVITFTLPPAWRPVPPVIPDTAAGMMFPIVAAFLIAHRPRLVTAWLMCAGGLMCALNVAATALMLRAAADGHLALAGYLRYPAIAGWAFGGLLLAILAPLYSPDGRLPSPGWRWVAWLGIGLRTLEVVRDVVRPTSAATTHPYGRIIPNPLEIPALAPYFGTITHVTASGVAVVVVAALLSLGVRFRRSDGVVRRQIAWPALAFAVYVVFLMMFFLGGPDFWLPVTVWTGLLPFAIAFAVMRYRLYGIDTVISRTVVTAGLLATVGAVYFGAGAVSSLVVSGYHPVGGLAAALFAGAFFQPMRRALQRSVDRMLYGSVGDPRLLAERLTQELRRADPAEALTSVITVVRDGLGVTGTAVEVTDGQPRYLESGVVGTDPRRIPLVWHGELVGSLLIGPQGPRRFAVAHDDRVLATLTPYAADVAHAVRMAANLQRSRERILTAREEERRRLRRDLHDGLGQTLSSMAMTINIARVTLKDSVKAADRLLVDLRTGMDAVGGDIRELVYGLRPPALDDLGLEGAIRALAGGGPPTTQVTVSGDLAELPAAVEVAVYRIVQEALTNIHKHARAGTAQVEVARTDALRVRISDDGAGLPSTVRAGVGTASMRERAAELGGTCTTTSSPGGGTVVEALIPLPSNA
ncbi:hypothetical protein GCM10022226_25360 [Sphaerisporangium flaviroseum]|uniref:Histidine kinase/HSP90-like ATPase domain-containing protein n=1 Tax=Sphaerisporangium flaviroseum TaxID=509199 RepID=A0ABP7HWG3_9ACTN